MKRTLLLLGLSCLAVGVSLGSTINSPSDGTTNFVFSGYDGGKEKEIDLAGSLVYLNAGGAGNDSCIFQATGSGGTADSQCLGSTFAITLTPQNSQTGSATWSIINKGPGNITSLTFDLQPGNSVFHPCGTPGSQGIVAGNCNNSGGSVSSVSGGLGIAATVNYFNLVQDLVTSGPQPYSPLYWDVTFTWGAGIFLPNTTTAFTFGANTDFFAPLPEPATYGMVGLALAGLGALRIRRRGASKS